ncbi:MAG TPA: hypothetical protein PK771_10090, partial [Spirochaetota bacterium]|nr:hypothetical protein [Spirochaetota bacterium]
PNNVVVDNNETEEVLVKFFGFNQERGKDDTTSDSFLFVGYDIYYYFPSKSETKKKANVKIPKVPLNKKLVPFPNVDLNYDSKQSEAKNKKRFPELNFNSTMDNFYKETTYPVTIDMIKNVLKDGVNNNVRFSFRTTYPDMTSDNYSNPWVLEDTANKYIQFGGIYPNEDEYVNYIWGDEKDGKTFYGFYDRDYYDYMGIKPEKDDGSYSYFKVYFYIISKGFREADLSNRNRSYLESSQSTHIEVRFKVDNRLTKDH